LFGPVEEIVLFKDDITSRFRRNAVTFAKAEGEEDEHVQAGNEVPSQPNEEEMDLDNDTPHLDEAVHAATSHKPTNNSSSTLPSTAAARKLIKTLLDQSHLSPFPLHTRPQLWDYSSALSLYPLPTALVLCDAEMPAFAISYEGCHVINVGRVIDELALRKDSRGSGVAKWIEYDCRRRRGEERSVRF
jgi:DNA polymerase epsilon subunit 2